MEFSTGRYSNSVISIKNNSRFFLESLVLVFSALCIAFMFYNSSEISFDKFSLNSNSPEPVNNSSQFSNTGLTQPQSPSTVPAIVTDALAFKAMLTTAQQSTLQLTYTTALARKWSNLPCGTSCRNGLQLGTNLTASQYAAAMQIIKDALSNATNDGYDEFHQMNLAEAYLHINGGNTGYDSTLRWIAFLNTPTATGPWMLQFGGHHYAANIAFNNGHVIGATPFFMGLEPKTFTYSGVTYDPLGGEKNALADMFASLSTAQLTTASISTAFSDCVMIPGETNGGSSSFPAVAIGQPVSGLNATQQNLVLEAIRHYVYDMDSATAINTMAVYTSELASTYISFHGSGTSGNPSSFFNAQGNYARISGPHVWIEFSCQGGIVIQGQIHYHTVWRDRSHDYGVDLTGPAIDVSSTPVNPSVSSINCANAQTTSGTINVPYNANISIPYTGGNGIAYTTGTAISSTGITGLTATLQSGTLSNGNGTLVYTVSGTPTSMGTANFPISFGGQSCTLSLTINNPIPVNPTISLLNCANAQTPSGTINVPYNANISIPYTGGNGIAYTTGTAISSTGITGLTATLQSGTLSNGNGTLVYTVSGTATSTGTANFPISFGGQSCTLSLTINNPIPVNPTVSSLNCANAQSTSGTINIPYNASISVPYTGGNGIAYTTGTGISSTGTTGLTATLQSGTLSNGNGNLIYTVSGTPTSVGTASFAINFGGQSCTFSINIGAGSNTTPRSPFDFIILPPNPQSDQLHLVVTPTNAKVKNIFIYDVAGKLIYKQSNPSLYNGSEIKIDISNLSKAVYIIKLIEESTNTAVSKRFIKG